MSRMTLAFCLLSFNLTGCCQFIEFTTYKVSLVTAKLESMAPAARRCRTMGPCGECCNCIPHRPWTPGYNSDRDFHVTQHTAQRCAFVSLRAYRAQFGRPISHHFKMGFIAAYEDIAFNRCPSPPIVPPPKYWNAFYRSCAGKPCVQDWFAGYDAGLDMGRNNGVAQFGRVYLRRCNQVPAPAAPNCYDDGMMSDAAPVQPQFPMPTPINPVSYQNGQAQYDVRQW